MFHAGATCPAVASPTVRTVYAVSQGTYSNYGVLCVFENEADATDYADAVMWAQHRRSVKEDGGVLCECSNGAEHRQRGHQWDVFAEECRVEVLQLWAGVPVVRLDKYGYPE